MSGACIASTKMLFGAWYLPALVRIPLSIVFNYRLLCPETLPSRYCRKEGEKAIFLNLT